MALRTVSCIIHLNLNGQVESACTKRILDPQPTCHEAARLSPASGTSVLLLLLLHKGSWMTFSRRCAAWGPSCCCRELRTGVTICVDVMIVSREQRGVEPPTPAYEYMMPPAGRLG